MKKSSLFIFIILAVTAQAKEKKGNSRINLFFTPQYYLNNFNLNKEDAPHPIHTHNNLGANFGVDYARTTRYGFTINTGFEFGFQKYPVDLLQDLTNFDPEAAKSLKGEIVDVKLSYPVQHLSFHLLFGYTKTLNKAWSASVRGGAGLRRYLHANQDNFQPYFENEYYRTDDQSEIRRAQIWFYNPSFGTQLNILKWYDQLELVYELYFGVERQVNFGFIKKISCGVELTRNVFFKSTNYLLLEYSTSWQAIGNSIPLTDNYEGRNVSIGLRLGVSLWK
jgi:hypothetical protein